MPSLEENPQDKNYDVKKCDICCSHV